MSDRELLERAGFVDGEETDCTADFATVAQAWVDQCEDQRDALAEVLGADEFDRRQTERRIQLQAVRDGLLRRSLVVATRGDDQ